MKFQELKKSLLNGAMPIYLIEGEDAFLRSKAVELIKNAFLTFPEFNFDAFDADAVSNEPDAFFATISAYPFMADKRIVVLNGFYPTANELKGKMFKRVFTEDFETTILIIVNEKPSVNLKKLERVTLVDCGKLDEVTATKWVKQECLNAGVVIGNEACSLVLEFCRLDMTKISTEVKKLIAFAGKGAEITKESVEALTHKDTDYQIYELTEKIARSKNNEAMAIFTDMLNKNADKQRIFSAIFYHFRRLFYSAISACDSKELALSLGTEEWQIKKAKEQAKNFSPKRLKKINDKLCALDGDFKSGEIMLDDALFNSIFNVMIEGE